MKKFLTLCLIFSSFILCAQQPIVIQSTDMPQPGFMNRTAKDTLISGISFGNAGANQTYSFVGFQSDVLDTINHLALTSSQQSSFPNANVAITGDNVGFLFANTTPSQFVWEGITGMIGTCNTSASFSPVTKIYQFPTQYGGYFSSTSALQSQLAGSCVNQPVSTIRLTANTTSKDTIDGWGKVSTPVGTYKCLRQKRVDVTNTLIEIKLLPISPWSTFSNTTDTTVRYYYLTKETKGSVVTFEFDSNDVVTDVTWSLIPPAAPTVDLTATNTSAANYTFSSTVDGYPDSYFWNFGDGNTSTQQNPTHDYIYNGTYIICLTVTNAGGSNVDCDTIVVTNGITVVNHPPVAVVDTYSVSFPNSIVLNLTMNDVDQDTDALIITGACDPIHGTLTPGAVQYLYEPDSGFVGVDSFCYYVCDNEMPALCDTGMVYINVSQPVALPNAYFVWQYDVPSWTLNATNLSTNYTIGPVWYYTYDDFGQPKTDTIYTNNFSQPMHIGIQSLCIWVANAAGWDTFCEYNNVDGVLESPESHFRISPNPANHYIQIQFIQSGDHHVKVYDVNGRFVHEQHFSSGQSSMDISVIPSGVYFVHVANQKTGYKSVRKLLVE